MTLDRVQNQSVQTAPVNKAEPYATASASDFFYGVIQHPDIISPWGYRQRDLDLRNLFYATHNSLVQGTVSNIVKQIQSTPWKIVGGRNNTAYFQRMLQEAQFGEGWEAWLDRIVTDYLTQDFGAVVEIIGAGKPDREIKGRVTSIAQLDSLSCYASKNAEFPVIYFNEENNSMHRMHQTRAVRLVDMRSPRRMAYSNGFCALSRYVSQASVDIMLGRHDNEMLSDLPPAGILSTSGLTSTQWGNIQSIYEKNREADGQSIFRNTMVVNSIDPALPIKIEIVSFSALPENFDVEKFIRYHVNMLALTFGVDPQDIWPLSGQALGTGTQSEVLNQKAKGKMIGQIRTMLTRFLNRDVLPDGMEFLFEYKDTEDDKERATTAQLWISAFNSAQFLTDQEKRRAAANQVDALADVLLDPKGELIELPDDDPKEEQDETIAPDDAPLDSQTPDESAADNAPTTADDANPINAGNAATGGRGLELRRLHLDIHGLQGQALKDYADTAEEFFKDTSFLLGQVKDELMTPRAFSVEMRGLLKSYGMSAYLDGFADGGVVTTEGELESEERSAFLAWLAANSGYVDSLTASIRDGGVGFDPDAKARLWVNKSLATAHQLGLAFADANGVYEFVGEDGAESCNTCQASKGQRHRLKWWNQRDLNPKRNGFKAECGGWRCDHRLERVQRGIWAA